jgi:hypothetical protein
MGEISAEQDRKIMIDQIKKHFPIFKKFFELDINLREYSDNIYNFQCNKVYIGRQNIVKSEILEKTKNLFGQDYENLTKIKFEEQLVLNITDHHQVLNHPLLISDNIIANVGKFFQSDKPSPIFVISSGDVPPNNYFSRNGFQLHDKRIPIFSNSEKDESSCFIPKRDFNFIKKLKDSQRWGEFNIDEQNFLIKEYEKIKSLDFSTCKNYNDQITLIVKNTWPYLFEEKSRGNLPDLIYITQEELVTRCLLKILDGKNFITEFLFNMGFRERILNNFRGIVVTWDEANNKGTHFFWRKHPYENKSLRLYVRGDSLVPVDERFKDLAFKLEKEKIRDLLKNGQIYPSLFTTFSLLNFYFGIKPLVGHGSIIYLNLFRDVWIKTLEKSEFAEEVDNIKSYEIDSMISGLALFFARINGKLKTSYAYDVIYNGGTSEEYLNKFFEMKFSDLLSISVPGIYDYISQKYIPGEEKIKSNISADNLAEKIINWL